MIPPVSYCCLMNSVDLRIHRADSFEIRSRVAILIVDAALGDMGVYLDIVDLCVSGALDPQITGL